MPTAISQQEAKEQGFVTVNHSTELLTAMNTATPQIVAKHKDIVVGYALAMLQAFSDHIPILVPMFKILDTLSYKDKSLKEYNHFIMGQVCIAKSYRGQGIFDGLYAKMKEVYKKDYDFVVTEIATRNIRSRKAHYRVGFDTLHIYTAPDGEEWELVIWNWK